MSNAEMHSDANGEIEEKHDAHDTRRRIYAIVASASGNLVEWYDFYVYSFGALYFASQFFPAEDQTSQLLNAAAIFAAGFLMRPIGGWLFGRLADKLGRRTSMLISVSMMCLGSFAIAILPTYESIGLWAPLLLLLVRLLQGLSVGGEYGTTATYMSEVALAGRRGFFSSFQYVTLIGGQLLAVLVLVILQFFLTPEQLHEWGWRIPFAIGGLAAIVALYLRRTLHETSTEESRNSKAAGSFATIWKHHRKAFLVVVGFTAGGSLTFYTFTTYMQKYLVNTAGMNKETASEVMTVALFAFMLMQPLFGYISDKVGRKPMMIAFGGVSVLTTIPLLTVLGSVQSSTMAFVYIAIASAIVSMYTSIGGIVKSELFPAEVRALGVGFSYAIANAIFGGTAEYVALWFKKAGFESGFFWYVTIMMVIVFIVGLVMPDPRKHGYLQGHGTH
ncbi:MFS family transporter [Brucella pseudogrignonensis]|uniref:MFS family transporter n=1 Tax=Brucella pseudogrignonensis TaxID=419475 RepID=UPI000CFB1AFD|nr:MFS family transporter [Brucella pseudogrignonensis]MQP39154.1 MFS transporter [Ochrobactrum sp. MYb237]PQZ43743.1 alpha-ketoglutarate permease [Brucella pseudogrignonensis]PRA43490.1 alpha-ketoglutarate permease [Brucella pseudogrignonensis]PRA72041.1 alpha-ketoglutarate permease [Brucella pseudogrignonensis]